jgi:hypothetical protein
MVQHISLHYYFYETDRVEDNYPVSLSLERFVGNPHYGLVANDEGYFRRVSAWLRG